MIHEVRDFNLRPFGPVLLTAQQSMKEACGRGLLSQHGRKKSKKKNESPNCPVTGTPQSSSILPLAPSGPIMGSGHSRFKL